MCRELRTPGVDGALRRLEPLGVEHLDGVGGLPNEPFRVLVGAEVGEHPVGERARIAAPGAPHADAQAEELRRAEMLRDRAHPVVTGSAAAQAGLQPAELEVALVVDDEDGVRLELEELQSGFDRRGPSRS